MVILRSKAPLRISLAGGGTDVSPYPEERGGAVLNCTIDKFAYATLHHEPAVRRVTVRSLDYNLSVDYERPEDLAYNGELDLVKAALRVLRPSNGKDGGDGDLELFLHSDAPPGTGLGSSSTMCVALVGAFQRWLRQPWTPDQVAELAYRIERQELGMRGGRQDQYAAAFGGFNFIEFHADKTIVNPLKIPPTSLTSSPTGCCSATPAPAAPGSSPIDLMLRQQESFRTHRPDTVQALDATKALAISMKNELLRGRLDEMGRLLDEGWQLKKRFTDGDSRTTRSTRSTPGRGRPALLEESWSEPEAGGTSCCSATLPAGPRWRRRWKSSVGGSWTSPWR